MTTRQRETIRYQGVEYDLQEATREATIGDARELLKVGGVAVSDIAKALMGMGEMQSAVEVFDKVERLEAFAAMLFLCLRKAGRKDFTWADALDVPMVHIQLVIYTPDEEEDADPKAPDLPTPDEPEARAATSAT